MISNCFSAQSSNCVAWRQLNFNISGFRNHLHRKYQNCWEFTVIIKFMVVKMLWQKPVLVTSIYLFWVH